MTPRSPLIVLLSRLMLSAIVAFGLSGAAQAADCYAPQWRTVTDVVAGASYEMTAEPTTSYFIGHGTGFPSVSTDEMSREGNAVGGRCSSFSVTVMDFGDKRIADPEGLFSARQADGTKGLRDGKLVTSRSLKVGGFPAREYSYSFVIDYFFTPASHRVLEVARGNRLMVFHWVWGDAGPAPADSNRQFASIRLLPAEPSPHLASFAMLQEVLKKYWMFPSPGDKYGIYFDPALRARLDRSRAADSAVIKAFGYPRDTRFLRMEGGAKVIRIKHDSAPVDWTVADNGKAISAISWRKVDPNAPATSSSTAAAAPASRTVSAAPPNLDAIAAAQARFVNAIVTAPPLGTRFTVATQTDKCRTKYALLPADKTPEQVLQDTFNIDWRRATTIEFMPGKADATPWWKDYVNVNVAPEGYFPLHPGNEQIGAMLSAGNELIALCKGAPPAAK